MAALRVGLLPLKEDGRLQSCRLEGFGAWIPGGSEAGALEAGWLARKLADSTRLVGDLLPFDVMDASVCGLRGGRGDACVLTRSTLREVGGCIQFH